MRILVACEFSGIVREAFAALGHESWSCDLLPTEIPGNHYQGDIRDVLYDGWELMVAHPPCTRLCNSGVRWLAERNLWQEMQEAAEFFKLILKAPIKKKAIENPIPHKYALAIIGRKYDQIIQPHQFGHGETKATCLWLENLDELLPTNQVEGREHRIHLMSPGANRSHERSRFFPGIANAMAAQWAGCLTQRAPDSLKAGVLSLPDVVKVESVLPAVSG
jgi:hypothetical protein